jgi:hypothetical protein
LPPDDLPPDDFPFPPAIVDDYAEITEYAILIAQIEVQCGSSLIEYSNVDGLYFDVCWKARVVVSRRMLICQSEI